MEAVPSRSLGLGPCASACIGKRLHLPLVSSFTSLLALPPGFVLKHASGVAVFLPWKIIETQAGRLLLSRFPSMVWICSFPGDGL